MNEKDSEQRLEFHNYQKNMKRFDIGWRVVVIAVLITICVGLYYLSVNFLGSELSADLWNFIGKIILYGGIILIIIMLNEIYKLLIRILQDVQGR